MRNTPEYSRRENRLTRALTVRFTVNGGPEHFSDTLNFSTSSLAIRSDCRVAVGDRVEAIIEHLPPLDGAVARVWKEGFAVVLSERSLALAALADGGPDPAPAEDEPFDLRSALAGGPVAGRLTPISAPHPCWFSITRAGFPGPDRRRLLLITTASLRREDVLSTWLSVAGTRWLVRPLDARRDDRQSIVVLRINDWQLRKAAEFGFGFTAVMRSLEEWTAAASPEAMKAQFTALAGAAA